MGIQQMVWGCEAGRRDLEASGLLLSRRRDLLLHSCAMSHSAVPHFGICIRNEGCEDLQLRKLYQILPDETAAKSGFLRVVDDSGEDYLYPADSFTPVGR